MGRAIEDVVKEVNAAVLDRWRGLDPLLPSLPGKVERGAEMFQTDGGDGFAACRHVGTVDTSLDQTWGAKARYVLRPRIAGATGDDVQNALDQLLTKWRGHLTQLPEARADDTAAVVNWPARDVAGVLALLGHGMQPMTVLAARQTRPHDQDQEHAEYEEGLVIREALADDLDAVVEMEIGVIRYDAQFGGAIIRSATEGLVRADTERILKRHPTWTWLAERPDSKPGNKPVGLLVIQPPSEATWITPLVGAEPAAYLQTLFVRPDERAQGIGAKLVQTAHNALAKSGVGVTLLHYAQVNPVSSPFWGRMGYHPLWTMWETRPAAALR
jgi:GNAT superfamily N-acetyltransferase